MMHPLLSGAFGVPGEAVVEHRIRRCCGRVRETCPMKLTGFSWSVLVCHPSDHQPSNRIGPDRLLA